MSQALIVISSVALVGCGGDDERPAAQTGVTVGTVLMAPPATATTEAGGGATTDGGGAQTQPTPTTRTQGPEDRPEGAGDEEPMRVPVRFRIEGQTVTPATVTVPAFLSLEITITADEGVRRVMVDAPGAGAVALVDGRGRLRLDGLKPGTYRLVADNGARATLQVTPGGESDRR